MKFFTDLSEAERYAKSQPYFQPLAITRAKETNHFESPVPLAFDVACGTGHSTTALMSIAERVIGIAISFNMLARAKREERIQYVQALAESLPFESGTRAIMSTALAFHWFDRGKFLSEVWRVLANKGLLLIYTNGFTGIMREDPAFQKWSQEVYTDRFPTPTKRI